MPVYEYGCANGHRIEIIHGVDAAGPAGCPACGAPMRKLLSAPAIVFKGTGWAKKDARSSSKRPADGKAAADAGSEKRSQPSPEKPADKASSTTSKEAPASGD